jgi:aryl-alcohol dehydrogenase-like predicted oxidoreductase
MNNASEQRLALGCMSMSGMYGASDESESLATMDAALEAGITLFDTGDFYGMGHNELLLGRALKGKRDRAIISVKFGAMRGPDGSWIGLDLRPEAIKNFLSYTLVRLGVDYIDLYRPARYNPAGVPIEETMGAVADLIKAGYIRQAALSEVGPDTIRRAHAITPIADLQIEYSLISRGPEQDIFPVLEELGIGLTAYGVLSRGLLSGSKLNGPGDFRAHLPRFSGENLARNQKLVEGIAAMAATKGASATQLSIAYVLAKRPYIVPLIGARKRTQLVESIAAASLKLSADEVAQLEALVPPEAVGGDRYDKHQMAMLDSERK